MSLFAARAVCRTWAVAGQPLYGGASMGWRRLVLADHTARYMSSLLPCVVVQVPPLWHSSPCLLPQDYGNPERSGKMQVLAKVLRHWREQGHK